MTTVVFACLGLTAVNLVLTAVLFRQLGLFVLGSARGAEDAGIAVGRLVPALNVPDITTGETAQLPIEGARQLFMFASTTCKECADIYPDLVSYVEEKGIVVHHFVFGRDETDIRRYKRRMNISGGVYAATQEIGTLFDVDVSPFAFAVDERGVVVDKGLVNARTQILRLANRVYEPNQSVEKVGAK